MGIRNQEQDALNVLATFLFTNPLGGTQLLNAVGTATTGSVVDSAVDYTLDWSPLTVNFGLNGMFEIDLQDLSFSTIGTKDQNATIKLLALPQASAVPEPASVALLCLGLAGLGCARRKSKA